MRFGGLVVSCVGSSHTVSQYLESLVLKWVLELWLDRPLCHKVRVITASVPVCLSSCLLPAGRRALSWWREQGWGRRQFFQQFAG